MNASIDHRFRGSLPVPKWHDALVEGEDEPDLVRLSDGEPTIRPAAERLRSKMDQ